MRIVILINVIVGALNVGLLVVQVYVAVNKPESPTPIIKNYISPSTIKEDTTAVSFTHSQVSDTAKTKAQDSVKKRNIPRKD